MARRKASRHLVGYAFVAPALLVYCAFIVFPILYTFRLSFYEWSGATPEWGPFVGADNYIAATRDPVFWASVRNNALFILLGVPAEVACGVVLALLLNTRLHFRRLLRTLVFVPVVLPVIAVGVIFGRIYDPTTGLLNTALRSVGLGLLAQQWLGQPELALWSVAAVSVWKTIGFTTVILLAGLQSQSPEVLEAARIDGAGAIRAAISVQIPLLRPTIAITSVLAVIAAMKVFDLIYVLTRGGPLYGTEMPMTLLYRIAFQFNQMGVAAAIAVMLAATILLVSWLQLRVVRGVAY